MKNKSTVVIVIGVIFLALAAFMLGQRNAHMRSSAGAVNNAGNSGQLAAVSADGKSIPLSAEVEAITGKLENGSAAQQVGDMVVVFSLNPYPASMRQLTNFSVNLTDAKGAAINDAVVTLNLTMPEMWMPPNQPAMQFASDGTYRASGQFTMRGWWRIEVVITRGGQTQSAFFDVGL